MVEDDCECPSRTFSIPVWPPGHYLATLQGKWAKLPDKVAIQRKPCSVDSTFSRENQWSVFALVRWSTCRSQHEESVCVSDATCCSLNVSLFHCDQLAPDLQGLWAPPLTLCQTGLSQSVGESCWRLQTNDLLTTSPLLLTENSCPSLVSHLWCDPIDVLIQHGDTQHLYPNFKIRSHKVKSAILALLFCKMITRHVLWA